MVLYPENEKDGPVDVTFTDGTTERWDRIHHNQSGMITLYNVNDHQDSNFTGKGNKAKTVNREKIEEIDWTGFGSS